ncbi:TonB-dependent receptor domain-containing protein [Achromobacter aloeverae]
MSYQPSHAVAAAAAHVSSAPARTQSGFRPTRLAAAIHLALLVGLGAAAWQPAAQAQAAGNPARQASAARAYDIPAGPLDIALARFVTESGVPLAAAPELVRGRQSAGLRGTFDTQAALDGLLAGTGLTAVAGNGGAYVLRQAPATPAATGAAAASPSARSGEAAPQTLGTVTVTATGYEQSVAEAPASVTVLTREEIARKPYANLQDALTDVEGVSVVGASANKQDINIRGMPGKYTLILVDGVRQGTRELLNREELGMVQGAQIPPLAAIERIEVIRGPMSSLYGSDALGGVINIITRKVPEKWTGNIDLGTVLQQHSRLGNSRQADFYLAGPIKEDKVGLQIYGKANGRTEADVQDGSYGIRDRGVTAKLNIKPTSDQDITLEAGQDEYFRYATTGKSLDDSTDDYRLNMRDTHFRATHEGRWGWGNTTVSLQHEIGTSHNTIGGDDTTSYPDTRLSTTVLDAKAVVPLSSHILTLGGQFLQEKLSGTDNEAASGAKMNTVSRLSEHSWALFGEDEWALTDRLSFTGGLRMDHHEFYGQHWSPRGYLVYQVSPGWTVKGGVARGFRAPELRQVAPDYYQATGGAVGAPRGTIAGNPDLKPETSTNTELGLHYTDPDGTAGGITFFHNDFHDKIYSQCISGCSGSAGATYAWGNIGRATLKGVETSLTLPVTDALKFSANYTYTASKRKSDDETAFDGTSLKGKPLDRTPRHSLNLRADWEPAEKWALYAAAHVQSEQYWANYRNASTTTRRRAGATTYDLGASYVVNKNVTMRLSVLNVTDKRVPVDYRARTDGLDGNWLVDDGRRLWLSTSISF